MRQILFLTQLLLILQAAEGIDGALKEVPASEILNNISNGLPVEYDHVVITGSLDLKDLYDLSIKQKEYYGELIDIKIVASPIRINDSVIEGVMSFNNTILENVIDFSGSSFNSDIFIERSTFNYDADFSDSTFNYDADFSDSTFNGNADFWNSTFNSSAGFGDTTFNGDAGFGDTTFNGNAEFWDAVFNNHNSFAHYKTYAYFDHTTFNSYADFWNTTFNSYAGFSDSIFNGNAGFYESTFRYANFMGSTFNSYADFLNSTFNDNADFYNVTFNESACFGASTFNDHAGFRDSSFKGSAEFWGSIFNNDAHFDGSTFNNTDFSMIQFNKRASFEDTRFNGFSSFSSSSFKEDAIFENATFRDKLSLTRTRYDKLFIRWHNIMKGLVYDDSAYLSLLKNFKDIGYLEDHDRCYFEYRREHRDQDWLGMNDWEEDFGKLIDYPLEWFYGYGTKPLNAFFASIGIIIIFGFFWILMRLWAVTKSIDEYDYINKFSDILIASVSLSFKVFLSGTKLFIDPPPMPEMQGISRSLIEGVYILERILGALFSVLFFIAVSSTIVRSA